MIMTSGNQIKEKRHTDLAHSIINSLDCSSYSWHYALSLTPCCPCIFLFLNLFTQKKEMVNSILIMADSRNLFRNQTNLHRGFVEKLPEFGHKQE